MDFFFLKKKKKYNGFITFLSNCIRIGLLVIQILYHNILQIIINKEIYRKPEL